MNSTSIMRALGVAAIVVLSLASARIDAQSQGVQAAQATTAAPTFAKDVAPIVYRSCATCHRPDSIAPMSLLTYEDARPWARAIRQRVQRREMPPWYIDRHIGIRKFTDDPSLTDEEINTIAAWVDGGAQKGNPQDMPPAPNFADAGLWHIGKPDLIVTLPKDLIVPATGPDVWKDIVVDPGLTEDRYLQAVETKPSKGWRVIHHSVQNMIMPEGGDSPAGSRGTLINEYALGKNADIFPAGTGRLIKAGSKVNFNLHLHSIGEEKAANVELGLKFYPRGYKPEFTVDITPVGGADLDIPPNTDNVRADGYFTLTRPTRVLSFQPHMHNRGKAMCVEAIYPGTGGPNIQSGDRVEPLSCVDRYQFAWHIAYHYEEDVQPLLPAGTILHVIGWHNNTASNRFNPDPDQLVTFGQRTVDDMSFAWMKFIYLTEDQYKEQVAQRKARSAQHN
jgi:mono/diheme cytochrome c family protein